MTETPAERGTSPLTPAQRAEAEKLIDTLRAVKDCNDEPSECYFDSGPYCGRHVENDTFTPLLREAADALVAFLAATEPPWLPETKPSYEELRQAAMEYREACCAGMRVMAGVDAGLSLFPDDLCARFQFECRAVGVEDGFGKRNDEILLRGQKP